MLFIGKPFSMAMLNNQRVHVYASGWKTARVDVLRFEYVGWVGGILTFMYLAYTRGCYAAATSLVRGWVGWGGILTFMYLAYTRGCYAAATSLVRGWVGWGGILRFMYLAYIRGCYAAATSLLLRHWSQKHLGDRRCPMLP